MAAKELKNIFLSASIPFKERDPKYFDTSDVIAIRDSVIALASVVLPNHRLIWGGHPSITPIVYFVMEKLKLNIQEHVVLYQSKYFEHLFPEDNNRFQNVILTDNLGDKKNSLYHMRTRMLTENEFAAAVFIGGMEGVQDEFNLFKEFYPNALLLPIASTGAAANMIYKSSASNYDITLLNDYAYSALFKSLLKNIL
jgi:hypothetical protein